MAFDDIRFPAGISRGASGGPERRTDIVTTGSGTEERNSRWADSRRRYNAGFGIKTLNDIHAVIEFFEERRGRLHGFRWKDHADYKSCPPQSQVTALDQFIATGDGTTASYRLVKRYGTNLRNYVRTIEKPVPGTVRVAVGGVSVTEFTVDASTGEIVFDSGSIPAAGEPIRAGFEFDVPVRFDTDQLRINLTHFEAGDIPDIPVVEIRA